MLFKIDYFPSFVISDGNESIFSSVRKVFSHYANLQKEKPKLENKPSIHLMCFRHVREAVKLQISDKGVRKKSQENSRSYYEQS